MIKTGGEQDFGIVTLVPRVFGPPFELLGVVRHPPVTLTQCDQANFQVGAGTLQKLPQMFHHLLPVGSAPVSTAISDPSCLLQLRIQLC